MKNENNQYNYSFLTNMSVIVTGGSRGIGAAIVKKLCSFGAFVTYNFHLDKDNALQLADEIENMGYIRPNPVCADIKSDEQIKMLFYQAKLFGGEVTFLVNNAGTDLQSLIQDVTNEDWDYVMHTNLRSVFYCCREAFPSMIHNQKGCIVNISSVYGKTGAAFESVYAASKGGVETLTKSLALEGASCGIRVNAIAPGPILTEMLKKEISPAEIQSLVQEIPLKRLGKPEDIAEAVVFLLSPASSFITGQIITVDGGWKL